MALTKKQVAEQEEAREALREILPVGSRVATLDANAASRTAPPHLKVLVAAATSRAYATGEGWHDAAIPQVCDITWRVAAALRVRRSQVSGGILGYGSVELVYNLSDALYGRDDALGHDRL